MLRRFIVMMFAVCMVAACSCPYKSSCNHCAKTSECLKMKGECPKMKKGTCPMMKSGCCATTSQHVRNVSTDEMKTIVDSKSALIFDARSAKYDDGRRIPGAKALSYTSTKEELAAAIPTKDSPVVTYCANTQCPASAKLAAHLKANGYTNIVEYPEGIDGWAASGNKFDEEK